jgi:hypothetical protein
MERKAPNKKDYDIVIADSPGPAGVMAIVWQAYEVFSVHAKWNDGQLRQLHLSGSKALTAMVELRANDSRHVGAHGAGRANQGIPVTKWSHHQIGDCVHGSL